MYISINGKFILRWYKDLAIQEEYTVNLIIIFHIYYITIKGKYSAINVHTQPAGAISFAVQIQVLLVYAWLACIWRRQGSLRTVNIYRHLKRIKFICVFSQGQGPLRAEYCV